jgi:hypothetical protein
MEHSSQVEHADKGVHHHPPKLGRGLFCALEYGWGTVSMQIGGTRDTRYLHSSIVPYMATVSVVFASPSNLNRHFGRAHPGALGVELCHAKKLVNC